jgi:hypothetical protein
MTEETALQEILALELATYEPYYRESDPTAWVELFADKATYIEPWSDNRIEDGAIKEHVMAYAGQIPNFDYEILDPRVDLCGDTAVFAFNLKYTDPKDSKVTGLWKGTAIFTRTDDGWKKVHAHFSATIAMPG